jgi:hypothetical protein
LSLACNFVSTGFPGFAARIDALGAEARVVRDVVVALFGALVVLADPAARRALAVLTDFALADLAALLFAAEREGREAAAGLRLRVALDRAAGFPFFGTVRDDFLVAFFRAAMALHSTQKIPLPARTTAPTRTLPIVNAIRLELSVLRRERGRERGSKRPINKPLAQKSLGIKGDGASALSRATAALTD